MRKGSKHHLIVCGPGNPLAASLTAGNRHDVTEMIALADAIAPVSGKRGRPRKRPKRLLADRAYDSRHHRDQLRARHVAPVIAKRNTAHGSGLGKERLVVERSFAWLHQYRRLRVRYERRADIHEAFLTIGCALICFKALQRTAAFR